VFRKNKDNKKLHRLLLIILALVLLFFAYGKTEINQQLRSFFSQIFTMNLYFLDQIKNKSESVVNKIKLNETLYNENLLLKENIRVLTSEIEKNQSYIQNYNILKEDMGYYDSMENNIVTTKLFAVTPGPYIKEAYIAAGTEAGLENGDIVLYRGMLFGRVIETYRNFSKILLIFDLRSKISAITNNTKRKILLKGNNSEKLTIKYLSETEQIDDGESVITSNYCSLFPSNIKIGLVKIGDSNDPYILIPYKIKDIKYVQIIHKIKADYLNLL